MKIFAATALALLVACGAARAEDTIAPERIALAKAVMQLSGALKIYDNYDANLDAVVAQVVRGLPNVDPATIADIKKMADEEFQATRPQMLEDTVKIYARHFSQSDLKALIAFYKSDAGQHFAAELPAVSKECLETSAPFLRHFMERVQKYNAEKIAAQKAAQDQSKDQKDK